MKIFFLAVILTTLASCKESSAVKKTEAEPNLETPKIVKPETARPSEKSKTAEPPKTSNLLEDLRVHLSLHPKNQPPLTKQEFASVSLTKEQSEKAIKLLLTDRLSTLRAERTKEFKAKAITIGDKTLRYDYRTTGHKPKDGHSLYISMHGGGGAPAQVNDQQWTNQMDLYVPKEGIYLAPRAPTDTWNLWHQAHIDPLLDRLIENFITLKGINPNRIYIMGYSAGGDGTYQLAPRMADRWAAAAMMAGHPGDAKTYNLRNLAYFIQCGGKDHAYNRAKLCTEWGIKLDQLAASDPGGYPHKAIIYPQFGHWMNRADAQALPWMAKYTRNPWPKKIHWYQDDVTKSRFYWLENQNPKPKQLITAEIDPQSPQTITLTIGDPKGKYGLNRGASNRRTDESAHEAGAGDFTPIPSITLRLSDHLINLDKPITVKDAKGKTLYQGKVNRTIIAINQSLKQRPDPTTTATATLTINLEK